MKNLLSWSLPPALLVASCCISGCSSSGDDDFVRAANDSNIEKVGSVYQLYASRSGYTGPESKEELKNFVKTNEKIKENLERMGIEREKFDDYFISENDGKEFVLRWNVFINPDRDRSRAPLVFEQEGKNGVRQVLLSNRKILEVNDEEKYQALLNGKVSREDALTELEMQEVSEAL